MDATSSLLDITNQRDSESEKLHKFDLIPDNISKIHVDSIWHQEKTCWRRHNSAQPVTTLSHVIVRNRNDARNSRAAKIVKRDKIANFISDHGKLSYSVNEKKKLDFFVTLLLFALFAQNPS